MTTAAAFEITTSHAIVWNGWWVGYVAECSHGWDVELIAALGAPRDVKAVYSTRDLAIARARQELGLP